MPNEFRPRLSVEISQAQSTALLHHLEWGERRRLFSLIIDDLLEAFDRFGADKIIGAMKAREIKTLDLVKLDLGEPKNGHN